MAAAHPQSAPVLGKFYPALDRTIVRIMAMEIPPGTPEMHRMVMRTAKRVLAEPGTTRRDAETHALRFLMSHMEVCNG